MYRALLTLAWPIVIGASCKDKPAPAPAPPVEAPHDGVKLIQRGAAPVQTLRYRFSKGAKTASTLVCDVAIKTDGEGEVTPPLVVDLETVIEDVASDGTAKLRLTLTGARLQREGSADLAAQVAALPGIEITETLAPDGATSGARVSSTGSGPDKARAQLDSLLQSLAHVTTQLPAEAVGIGATWEERRTLPPGGITGIAKTIYTVTALTPTSFSYTSAGDLTGGRQTITRDGVTIDVNQASGHVEGKGTVALEAYALDVDSRTGFKATMTTVGARDAGSSDASTIEVTMATRMTPATAARADGGDAGVADAGIADGP
jgi:hypothetical protein